MKQLTLVTVLSILLILSGCSEKKALAPSTISGKNIEFLVQKTIDSDSGGHKSTLLYKFNKNNTYRATKDGEPAYAGGFSYSVQRHDTARIVLTISEHNQLTSYEMILTFNSPTTGTWESSYKSGTMETEAGTFAFVKRGAE